MTELRILQKPSKLIGSSILFGGLFLFSSIFINPLIDINWLILPLIGTSLVLTPIILFRPEYGTMKFQDDKMTIIMKNSRTEFLRDKTTLVKVLTGHFEGKINSVIDILTLWWPYESGYENYIIFSNNDIEYKYFIFAKDKLETMNLEQNILTFFRNKKKENKNGYC